MKVLFIAPNYFPHIGGVEKHIKHLCDEMLKDGHDISILVMKYKDDYTSYEKIANLEIIRVDRSRVLFGNRINITLFMILNFIKILKYDVIHFHDYTTFWSYGLPVWFPLKLFGKKMFVTFHGWEGVVPPRKRVVLQRKITEKLVDGNICIGHFIEKWYGTHADIVSYGGAERVALPPPPENDTVVFIGRLAADTGIRSYLKAWETLSARHAGARLLVCGDGVLREEIERYIEQNNIDTIELLGFVPDVGRCIRDAKVVLTAGYLGILEAFSYKKSVVSVYDSALKEDYLRMMPGSDDMMWIAQSVDTIITCVEEAMVDERKKEAGYAFALRNSWDTVAESYYELWKK